jgi:hypothetical protein
MLPLLSSPFTHFFLPSLLFFQEQWYMSNISLILKLVPVL